MKRLEQLCHQYTNLSESDIKELQRTARYLSSRRHCIKVQMFLLMCIRKCHSKH